MKKSLSKYLKLSEQIIPNKHEKRIKVGFLSSFTINGLPEVLRVKCEQMKISAQTYLGEYNQFNQDILDKNSKLYEFQPDVTFLILDIRSVLGDFFYFPYSNTQDQNKKFIEEKVDELINLVTVFTKNSSSKLIMSNIHIPFFSPYGIAEINSSFGYHDSIFYFNKILKEKIQKFDSTYLFNFNGFVSKYGEDNVFNYQNYFFGDIKIALNYIPNLAEHLISYVIAYLGITKKCIVLDLDNTLWGGIVGEDGFDGIQIGPQPPGNAFVEFQKHLKSLSQRGIILAINSKNNFDEAMNVIENHPHMILRKDDFSSVVINWEDKVQNMHKIAAQLNVGLDSFVFFDDDPVNREFVRNELPQVHVPEISSDPSEYSKVLLSLNDFSNLQITKEDISRKKMYQEQKQRINLQNSSADLAEFLKTLDLHVKIKKADNFTIPRISQLTLKTNQFNLTTRRYQKEEIEKFSTNENTLIGSAQVIDKFGDNGITGVFIVDIGNPKEWILDSFLLSCRVMGRQIENVIINYIIEEAKKNNVKKIKAQFIPTEKNLPIQNFLPTCGFQKEEYFWVYDVKKPFKSPEFVTVEVDNV